MSQCILLLWSNSESIVISRRILLVMLLEFGSDFTTFQKSCEKKVGRFERLPHKDMDG